MEKKTVKVGDVELELTPEQLAYIEDQTKRRQEDVEAFEEFVGKDIFVRTVTMAYTGHVEWVKGNWMKLTSAAWIADTGRFSDFVKKGKPTSNLEVEPMGTTVINTATFMDVSLLQMELPLDQK